MRRHLFVMVGCSALCSAFAATPVAELVFLNGQKWLVQGQFPGIKATSYVLSIGPTVEHGFGSMRVFRDPVLSKRNPNLGYISFFAPKNDTGSLIAQFPTFHPDGSVKSFSNCTVRDVKLKPGLKHFEGKFTSFNSDTFKFTDKGTCTITLQE